MFQPDSPINKCRICHERSTWEFLREFYSRVEAAHEYARSLEYDLQRATSLAQQSHHALSQSEASLFACKEQLDEGRLEHRATQEELGFERERHKETIDLLEKVFHEAIHSGEIVDRLSHELTILREASNFQVTQGSLQAPASLMEASLTKETTTSPDTPATLNQRSEPASTQPEECARSQHECDLSDTNLSNASESSSYVTAYSNTCGTTEQSQSVRDATAKAPRKRKPISRIKKARFPGSLER